MEGTSQRRKRVLTVWRGYESSRLEHAQLAVAYERVLPEVRVLLAERDCRPSHPTISSSSTEPVSVTSSLVATGGH